VTLRISHRKPTSFRMHVCISNWPMTFEKNSIHKRRLWAI
jgi:hypothetical protein